MGGPLRTGRVRSTFTWNQNFTAQTKGKKTNVPPFYRRSGRQSTRSDVVDRALQALGPVDRSRRGRRGTLPYFPLAPIVLPSPRSRTAGGAQASARRDSARSTARHGSPRGLAGARAGARDPRRDGRPRATPAVGRAFAGVVCNPRAAPVGHRARSRRGEARGALLRWRPRTTPRTTMSSSARTRSRSPRRSASSCSSRCGAASGRRPLLIPASDRRTIKSTTPLPSVSRRLATLPTLRTVFHRHLTPAPPRA